MYEAIFIYYECDFSENKTNKNALDRSRFYTLNAFFFHASENK